MRAVATAVIGAMLSTTIAAISIVAGTPTSASAVDGSSFDPGYIVSDANFYDGSAMSASQVQSFLSARVSSCVSGYTCLKDYTQPTPSMPANARCAAYQGSPGERASDIIAKVGVACSFSPKAMLVLLQKEQSLVTDTWPVSGQYNHATGYGCPDTAPCDPNYNGFFYQVYWAAYAFQAYKANGGGPNYKTGKLNTILWHPNASCGSSQVFIENAATAGLYNYTPYRPNAAALANLNGTGDSCSSYGNRNFWLYWWNWFGDPAGPSPMHGALDSVTGVAGGIQITGWIVNPYGSSISRPAYIWVTLDGVGGPRVANKPLSWIEGLYPGAGPNHGYDEVIAASPGGHRICVQHADSAKTFGCADVVVPAAGKMIGGVDSVTTTAGSLTVTGWAADSTSSAATNVRIEVDSKTATIVLANLTSASSGLAPYVPTIGPNHGFSQTISATPGSHTVCALDAGSNVLFGCKAVQVPNYGAGSFDVELSAGGFTVTGWALDQRISEPVYVWINVNGAGGPVKANLPSTAATTAFPSLSGDHGFSQTFKQPGGVYQVCVTNTADNTSLGCKAVTVASGGAASLDTAAGTRGGIRITGWAIDRASSNTVYPWVNVDGSGGPIRASLPLTWIDSYFASLGYPGLGPNHGFDAVVSAAPGARQVCVYGLDSVLVDCRNVSVPATGNLDSAIGIRGGVRVTGWAVPATGDGTVFPWVNVDGSGGPIRADKALSWLPNYFATDPVGPNHGFDAVVAATPGTHQICLYGTNSASLGCKTVVVPS